MSMPTSASDDVALVAQIRAGDVAAFEHMVLTYARPLTVFAWRHLRPGDGAEDLVQDVFADTWAKRATLNVQRSLRAYLYATVRNRALNVLKRAAMEERFREVSLAGAITIGSSPRPASDIVDRSELAGALRDAFGELSPRGREIARLWFQDGLSQPEIAQALGTTVSAVSNHVSRDGRRLRALLAGIWP